ncbi:SdpI family protein [Staphylococcus simulans]|uniref:SdpI family protein n=1 Tax=Staphylococcus simulans TaxID=1286 RepID=UPI000D03596B|nr:SdpI family protein [Staphylococcus simulans]MDQ7112053.1 SdpI family protein [Staphylococcus simulans]RIN55294.1 SdpI family protein [Staphylococcus simulans]RIN72322.1 SdpI family protein [Staphylococcus simulans]
MLLIALTIITLLIGYLVFAAQKNNVGDKPNYFIGYRTSTSMKSKQVWNYSQKEFKIVFIKMQFILLFIGSVWLIYDILNFPKGNSFIAQAAVYFISVIIVIIMTEIKVKKFAKKES